jgi:hypothetical protein
MVLEISCLTHSLWENFLPLITVSLVKLTNTIFKKLPTYDLLWDLAHMIVQVTFQQSPFEPEPQESWCYNACLKASSTSNLILAQEQKQTEDPV